MEHQPYINKFGLGGVTVREDDQDYKIISSAERGDAMPRQTVNVIRRGGSLLMPSSHLSLDETSSAASSYDSDEEYELAQKEWEESLNQLQQLVGIVLLPFFGKWLGRRWSHIGTPRLPYHWMHINKYF